MEDFFLIKLLVIEKEVLLQERYQKSIILTGIAQFSSGC